MLGAISVPEQACMPLNSTAATSGHLPLGALVPPITGASPTPAVAAPAASARAKTEARSRMPESSHDPRRPTCEVIYRRCHAKVSTDVPACRWLRTSGMREHLTPEAAAGDRR